MTQTIEKSPPSKGVKISYGQWAALFRIHGARTSRAEVVVTELRLASMPTAIDNGALASWLAAVVAPLLGFGGTV